MAEYPSVTICIAYKGQWIDLDTRYFDTVPRIGETIVFTQGVDMRKPEIRGTAHTRVIHVSFDLRVGYSQSVHAYVEIEPRTDADMSLLRQLYPEQDWEPETDEYSDTEYSDTE